MTLAFIRAKLFTHILSQILGFVAEHAEPASTIRGVGVCGGWLDHKTIDRQLDDRRNRYGKDRPGHPE